MANNIQLPRFQRKQTWDAVKNFELCISVFKNYPIGVSILSVDNAGGRSVRWLLDGRQRRNALKQTFEDPENVYFWAQKFIKFKNSDQPAELQEKFWEKVNEFLEAEEEENETVEMNNAEEAVDSNVDVENEQLPDDAEADNSSASAADLKDGLNLLYEIIRVCHNRSKKGTGFTLPFDFSKFVNIRLPYVIPQDGQYILSSKRLKTFLNNYITFCNEEGLDYKEKMSFIKFLYDQNSITTNTKLENYVSDKWLELLERINILLRIDDLFSAQTIGLIEVKNLKSSDSQKIFNLINSKGSPLKAVEILSARPKWNIKIGTPCAEVKNLVLDLYRTQMDITPEGVVRWDLAATFLRRLPANNIIFKSFTKETTDFEKELTIAFKCLSGIYVEGVTKIDIDKLADVSIDWETDIDQLVYEIKSMLGVLESFTYFMLLKSWKTTIQDMTSDAIALDFLILSYKEWKSQGKPLGNNTTTKIFQKYCFTLLDKLIYEYISSQWKGSGDSRIHNDIVSTEPINPITTEKWEELLEGIYATNKINDRAVPYNYMKPILFHTYALGELTPPATATGYDIDHIIPQSLFKSSTTIENKEEVQDNLFNLALLPHNENISKSNLKLSQIEDDAWLKRQIKEYEFIDEEDFREFSDVNNYKKMFEHRKQFFLDVFKNKRTYLLNN